MLYFKKSNKSVMILFFVVVFVSVLFFGLNSVNVFGETPMINANNVVTNELLQYMNAERASVGLTPLKLSNKLCQVSLIRANEINAIFSHTRPDGRAWHTAFDEVASKYKRATIAENLAYCEGLPDGTVDDGAHVATTMYNLFVNSPTHHENILDNEFKYVGITTVYCNGTYYTSVEFSSKR